MTPPLSLRGIYGSLRAPTLRDVVYSSKAFVTSALALAAGFSQNLENPYWSVLTVYIIVNPPGAGAIRSKAVFRFVGTLIGGALVIVLTGLFGNQAGMLLTATIAVIVGVMFLNQIDKTPASYIWFAVAVTVAVITLGNLSDPSRIFDLATARVGEISLGIFMTAAVDCVWPEPMTPGFMKSMAGWCEQARAFAIEAIGREAPGSETERRRKLRGLVKAIQMIDSAAIQLPFDVVSRAPRGRDLNLVRHQVVAIVADLVAIELRIRPLREREGLVAIDTLLGATTIWLRNDAHLPAASIDAHVNRGQSLAAEFEQARERLDTTTGQPSQWERGLLSRLATFLNDWCDLRLALRAVETGRWLPTRLERVAIRARPVRSVDYLGKAFDLGPLALALTTCSLIWYLTAWANGPTALLFSFAGCIFLVGQGQILQSTAGMLTCVLIAFSLVFFYQFAVLPRVTDFPVLIMVLGCALLPLGLLMAMSMAGMLIAALTFSFLGLQNAYAADFAVSFQTLVGSLAGLLIAVICLRVCAYDHARFATSRLSAAVRRDVIDVARAARPPHRDRFRSLALYRLSLYFTAAEELADGGSLARLGLFSDLSVGNNLLSLRRLEGTVSAGVRRSIIGLRDTIAAMFREKLAGRADDGASRSLVVAMMDDPAIRSDAARDELLDALTSLDLALGHPPLRASGAVP